MRYAMSAGTIVLRDRKVLLVRHRGEGYDFWIPPGGRLRGSESLFDCAARETREETGLCVRPQRILYVEEFIERDLHFCKVWTFAPDPGGEPNLAGLDPDEDFVVDVRFASRDDIQTENVFPAVLRDDFWSDLEQGRLETRYLGLQRIGD